ncbi:MAG: UDP-N-acetylmuramyl-tripeptide synthetase [Oscillospiraceae bacterium]|nr:UDP-N-acetylmuramyl-tripeptide synthetase [Oscillospiraceae bacterium]MBQ8732815.1 UDP-N-acetylmuramyl-tripeptide synthetase [Oscillospiraceae bacterium]
MVIQTLIDALKDHGVLSSFRGDASLSVGNLCYDSRQANGESLFICKGFGFRPEFLTGAVEKGAPIYMSETDYPDQPASAIIVNDVRKGMAVASLLFYQHAYRAFKTVGITGTKGKTTTTYFVKNILDRFAGKKTAVLSTVEVYTGKTAEQAHLTTPEAPDLHRFFAETKESEIPFLTMEVSSQGYKMSRVYGMTFDVGVFLNLDEDHISEIEHPDFEDYLSCKLELFRNCRIAVMNRQAREFERFYEVAKNHCEKVYTYGVTGEEDYWSENVRHENGSLIFDLCTKEGREEYRINVLGRFNVENALAAAAVCKALGVDRDTIRAGLERTTVEGRMNVFEKNGVTVIVDYAHNFLSFSRLYESLKQDFPGRRLVPVFGCPGGKAYLRRRDLGVLSGQNADFVYLTAEDPQFEDVTTICEEIAEYLKPYHTPYTIIPDRKEAVVRSITEAKPGDVVILLGKSEELYQKVRGVYEDYESDLILAEQLMK